MQHKAIGQLCEIDLLPLEDNQVDCFVLIGIRCFPNLTQEELQARKTGSVRHQEQRPHKRMEFLRFWAGEQALPQEIEPT